MPAKRQASQTTPESEIGLERLVSFSDAVMAIAITLLAVDIRVPEISTASAPAELPSHLMAMAPQALSFVISFIVVGVYWMSHHRYFRYIKRYDSGLMLLNLLFLLFIASLPFFSSLLGTYANVPIAEALYALVVACIGLSLTALWVYACHDRRLVDKEIDPRFIRGTLPLAVGAPILFLISVPVALIQPAFAPVVWWLAPVLGVIAGIYSRRRSAHMDKAR